MNDNIISSDGFSNPNLKPNFYDKINKQYHIIMRLVDNGAHPFTVFDKTNTFVDAALAELYPVRTCTRGCSHCCYVPVGLTALEADYIEDRTGHKQNANVESMGKARDPKEKTACPFLKDNECSIYEYRPMVCRAFLSFDDIQHCIDSSSFHFMTALKPPGDGGFEWANAIYFHPIMHYLERLPERRIFADIRDFFTAPSS